MTAQTIKQPRQFDTDLAIIVVSALVLTALGGYLWKTGAFFTMEALALIGITASGVVYWLIPAGISILEIALLTQKQRLPAWSSRISAIILLVDGFTTFIGVEAWLLGGGLDPILSKIHVHIPVAWLATSQIVASVLVALALTLIPEKIIVENIKTLKKALLGGAA